MPCQTFRLPATDGRQRRSFFMSIMGGLAGGRRRQGRCRPSASMMCYYIAAVVLLQNMMMVYNAARRASLNAVVPTETIISNLTLKRSANATATAKSVQNQAAPARQRTATAVNDSIPLNSRAASLGLLINQMYQGSTARRHTAAAVRVTKPPNSRASSLAPLVNQTSLESQRMYYRKRTTKVNPYKHVVLLVPTQLCDANTVMVIMVNSATQNIDKRSAIRETWGDAVSTGRWPKEQQNGSCVGLRLAFVLGQHKDDAVNRAIREEHATHGDIVQGDFIDDYHNMTLKSLLSLKVVDERCRGVRYLLKTDDDMIVNLPYLLLLLTNKNLQRSIMGPVNVGSRAHRTGKWKLTSEEFPFPTFPPYEAGSAYVITADVIHELFVTSDYVPYIFIDDVYVTGILGRIIGINHVRHRGFAFWGGRPPSVCDIVSNRVVAGTKMNPALLRSTWKQLYTTTCPAWA